MNSLRKKYYYKKQVNGKGRFGGVELELIQVHENPKIVDKCEWKDWKKHNIDFKETPILKSIKTYILNSIKYIIQNYTSVQNFELNLIDIQILPVDTLPSHILAATIIGCFELVGKNLSEIEIQQIDDFITENNEIEFPNYEELILNLIKK